MAKYQGKKESEFFAGNTYTENGIPEHVKGLKTARLGAQALDIEGHTINPDLMRPLFIDNSEAKAYDRIMMARYSKACR